MVEAVASIKSAVKPYPQRTMSPALQTVIICTIALILLQLPPLATCQHREGTVQYSQAIEEGDASLSTHLQSHPDVFFFH